jgi:Cell differentiation family, Rcd1-like
MQGRRPCWSSASSEKSFLSWLRTYGIALAPWQSFCRYSTPPRLTSSRSGATIISHTVLLVQEITLIYPQLQPPELNTQTSNRVCNALALFQCVASHSETRELFLQAHIPLFLYPFLNTTSKTRPFEYLRLTALGVIGALVKQDDSTVCPRLTSVLQLGACLLQQVVPQCLSIHLTS